MLLCLLVEHPVSGSEEGGSQVMRNTENLCYVLFFHSCVQGKGTHQHGFDEM